MTIRSSLVPALLASTILPLASHGQGAAEKPDGNMVDVPGFERFATEDNLWDGVDGEAYLAGFRHSVAALAESGLSQLAMPMSIGFEDLTGDGLPDLLMADPVGYYRLYPNSGTPAEPKFTQGELLPIFLDRSHDEGSESQDNQVMRRVPKIHLVDWSGRGAKDILLATYSGEVFLLPNSGSVQTPRYEQPRDLDSLRISTNTGNQLWGNLFAPLGLDWNGDRRLDLVMGEGSYSANAIHLLLNQGSTSSPKFTQEARYYLAFGDGKEHLHPTPVDYNGDGRIDLLVTDRTGQVSLYLNHADWKPGDELKFSSLVSFGGKTSLGSGLSITTGDYNGDGKFDILMGKTNGRVAVALNTGTATEPAFAAPFEIKGEDLWKRDVRNPSGWTLSTGHFVGSHYGVISAVSAEEDENAEPPEGKYVLKAYYNKPLNKLFQARFSPGGSSRKAPTGYYRPHYYTYRGLHQTMVVERDLKKLKSQGKGTRYNLTFKYKGNGVRNAFYVVDWHMRIKTAPDKVEKDERGGAKVQRFEVAEGKVVTGPFNPGTTWQEVKKAFTVSYSKKELQEFERTGARILLCFELADWDSVLYLDDFQLVDD